MPLKSQFQTTLKNYSIKLFYFCLSPLPINSLCVLNFYRHLLLCCRLSLPYSQSQCCCHPYNNNKK